MKNQKLLVGIVAVMVIAGLSFFFTRKSPVTEKIITEKKDEAVASSKLQKMSSVTQESATPSQFISIDSKNIAFKIPNLPDVDFKITKAIKATGEVTRQTGCNGSASELFLKNLYFSSSGLCIRDVKIDGQDMAMIAVDISVNNGSAKIVSGDLVQLFYTIKIDGKESTRLAQTYLPFRSYDISPYSQQNIRVGFLIPYDQNEFRLVYGYVGADYRSGEDFLGAGEGGFILNFKTKTMVEITG